MCYLLPIRIHTAHNIESTSNVLVCFTMLEIHNDFQNNIFPVIPVSSLKITRPLANQHIFSLG